jgi:hypothetical protein
VLIAISFAAGAVAGIVLAVLTYLVAGYGPSGGTGDATAWSFRGNGALIVPFGLGPAFLAGAWSGLMSHAWGDPAWWRSAWRAALVGIILVLSSVALTVLGAAALASVALLVSLGWMIVAPVVALARRPRGAEASGTVQHALGGVVVTVALIGAFVVAGRVLPPAG